MLMEQPWWHHSWRLLNKKKKDFFLALRQFQLVNGWHQICRQHPRQDSLSWLLLLFLNTFKIYIDSQQNSASISQLHLHNLETRDQTWQGKVWKKRKRQAKTLCYNRCRWSKAVHVVYNRIRKFEQASALALSMCVFFELSKICHQNQRNLCGICKWKSLKNHW